MADFETKHKFVYKYVDYIDIKKTEDEKKAKIDIVGLNIVAHKVQMMAELSKNNMIDEIISHGGFRVSKAEYKSTNEALKYIDILKKKFNFNVIDVAKNKDYYVNDNLLFKVIGIDPTRKVEKQRTLLLELCDESEENEQEILY